jgi:hypothetical protein
MKFANNRGLQSPRWFQNEIAKSDDINFIGTSSYINLTNILSTLAREKNTASYSDDNIIYGLDIIIGGLTLEHSSGMTLILDAGSAVSYTGSYLDSSGTWGFSASADEVFSVTVGKNQSIALDDGGIQDRIDLIEIRPAQIAYDSKARNFKDPVTGLVTTATVNTKLEYGFEFQILKGTEGAMPIAPIGSAGWITIGEVYVAAGVTDLSTTPLNIKDARSSRRWQSIRKTRYSNNDSFVPVSAATTIDLGQYSGDVVVYVNLATPFYTVTFIGNLEKNGSQLHIYMDSSNPGGVTISGIPYYSDFDMSTRQFINYVKQSNADSLQIINSSNPREQKLPFIFSGTGNQTSKLISIDGSPSYSVDAYIEIPQLAILVRTSVFGTSTTWHVLSTLGPVYLDLSTTSATLDGSTVNYLIAQYGNAQGSEIEFLCETTEAGSVSQVTIGTVVSDGTSFAFSTTYDDWFTEKLKPLEKKPILTEPLARIVSLNESDVPFTFQNINRLSFNQEVQPNSDDLFTFAAYSGSSPTNVLAIFEVDLNGRTIDPLGYTSFTGSVNGVGIVHLNESTVVFLNSVTTSGVIAYVNNGGTLVQTGNVLTITGLTGQVTGEIARGRTDTFLLFESGNSQIHLIEWDGTDFTDLSQINVTNHGLSSIVYLGYRGGYHWYAHIDSSAPQSSGITVFYDTGSGLIEDTSFINNCADVFSGIGANVIETGEIGQCLFIDSLTGEYGRLGFFWDSGNVLTCENNTAALSLSNGNFLSSYMSQIAARTNNQNVIVSMSDTEIGVYRGATYELPVNKTTINTDYS